MLFENLVPAKPRKINLRSQLLKKTKKKSTVHPNGHKLKIHINNI